MTIKRYSNNVSRSYILHNGKLVIEINRDYHAILAWIDGDIINTMQIQTLACDGRGRLNHKNGEVFQQTIAELVKLYK